MDDATILFSVDGEVTAKGLAKMVGALAKLVDAVAERDAPGAEIRWVVSELSAGSASAVLAGKPIGDTTASDAAQAAHGYLQVGRDLANGVVIGDAAVASASDELRRAVSRSGNVAVFGAGAEAVKLSTSEWQAVARQPDLISIGSVIGTLEAINLHDQRLAIVWDEDTNDRVLCYFEQGLLSDVRDGLGRRVTVSGRLKRHHLTQAKIEIRQIIKFAVLDERPTYRFENAFGVGSWKPGDPTSDELIRRGRDAR